MVRPDLLRALAALLEYPGPDLDARVAECEGLLAPAHREAATRLAAFARWQAATPPGRVQEAYAAAFDLDPSCSPHVGHRLLGGDPRRGVFMARLAARYRARGFSAGRELPDHAAVILRFMAQAPDEPDGRELVDDCLAPAVASLARELSRREHPYAPVAQALELVLAGGAREERR